MPRNNFVRGGKSAQPEAEITTPRRIPGLATHSVVSNGFQMYIIISKRTQRAVSPETYVDKLEADANRKEMERPEELESVPTGSYDSAEFTLRKIEGQGW